MNISMLRCFFEVGSEADSSTGLKSSKEKELCRQYMGQVSVISFSLKGVSAELR